ncbi:MAG: sigma-70 family RNA polymerase sigma factor [Phaeodactylibacter sp.]|nr:sigma-70 family RNA polymerase sigma factor [Phaeodactylibacter sp.]
MAQYSNEWYLEHLKNGHAEGIQAIQSECFPSIANFIKTHGGSQQDAEDVFTDGLVAIFRKLKAGEVSLTCKFSVFLFQICKNLWYKQTRRKKFQSSTPVEEVETPYVTEEWTPAIEQTERFSLLQECFLKLSEQCRKLLSLSWHTEKSMQEVAEALGLTYGHARKQKSQCNTKLKDLIKANPKFEELRE